MERKRFIIAIFASGNGTNAEAIIKHFKNHPQIGVALLLSNNPQASALERARGNHVLAKSFDRKQYQESDEFVSWLKEARVTHVVLAGFLWLVPDNLLKAFPDKIINIHPALLPKFGGKGMYGDKVHQSVKFSGEKETGITIHLVNEHFDEGRILFQANCSVSPEDSPETIAKSVHALEYKHYPTIIENWILGKL